MIHAGRHDAQMIADQAHIVSQWHPAQTLVILHPLRRLDNGANIRAQIAVRQTDTFRVTRRARRVLNERRVLRRCVEDLSAVASTHIAHENCAGLEKHEHVLQMTFPGEINEALEKAAIREQGSALELSQNAEQFGAVFVTDSDGDRNRHDAAQYCCPEGNNKILVGLTENNQLIAWLHATRLQRPKERSGTIPEIGKRHDTFIMLAVNEPNVPFSAARLRDQVRQCIVQLHDRIIAERAAALCLFVNAS